MKAAKKKTSTASAAAGSKRESLPKIGKDAATDKAASSAAAKRPSVPFTPTPEAETATAGAAPASAKRKATGSVSSRTASSSKKKSVGGPRPPAAGKGARRSTVGGRGGRGRGGGAPKQQQHQLQLVTAALEAAGEEEQTMRHEIEVTQDLEFDSFRPIYNVLVMEMVRGQVEQVNLRQRSLNEMLETLKEEGLLGGDKRQDSREEQRAEELVDRLRERLQNDAVAQVQNLKAENVNLKENLEAMTLALEKKASEMEVMRTNFARKLARSDVENDTTRAEVQATLHASALDVERIKRELAHRIDIACASIRTPRYNTSLEEMRELTRQVQAEIQQHHDELTKLVVSIGAKDTFLKNDSDTMHSNLPTQYRTELRKMEKDQLLNLLDVLSFQDGVVDTVGKAIYVVTESQHKTAVV
jgi:hypothetical protein